MRACVKTFPITVVRHIYSLIYPHAFSHLAPQHMHNTFIRSYVHTFVYIIIYIYIMHIYKYIKTISLKSHALVAIHLNGNWHRLLVLCICYILAYMFHHCYYPYFSSHPYMFYHANLDLIMVW